jgi:hypothetical protein
VETTSAGDPALHSFLAKSFIIHKKSASSLTLTTAGLRVAKNFVIDDAAAATVGVAGFDLRRNFFAGLLVGVASVAVVASSSPNASATRADVLATAGGSSSRLRLSSCCVSRVIISDPSDAAAADVSMPSADSNAPDRAGLAAAVDVGVVVLGVVLANNVRALVKLLAIAALNLLGFVAAVLDDVADDRGARNDVV